MADLKVETVKKIDLHEGDILLVQIGGDVGEEVYIPTAQELLEAYVVWQAVVPEGVNVIVTHHMMEPTILESHIKMHAWPPKLRP